MGATTDCQLKTEELLVSFGPFLFLSRRAVKSLALFTVAKAGSKERTLHIKYIITREKTDGNL